jgi:formylglycine-generating enzyme
MNAQTLWTRTVVLLGGIALWLGALSPGQDLGVYFILPGVGMITLGVYLGKEPRTNIPYRALRVFILLALFVGTLFALVAKEAIEPLDFGLMVVLPGIGMGLLGLFLIKGRRGIILYWVWTLILIAGSTIMVILLLTAGRIGGHMLRRAAVWAELLVIPYAVGYLMGLIGTLVMMIRFFLPKANMSHILTPRKWVWRLALGCLLIGIIASLGWKQLNRIRKSESARKVPSGMVLVPAGSFTMGDPLGDDLIHHREEPTHSVQVSAFYLDRFEVTKALWDEVYRWGMAHGYCFNGTGSGKGTNYPVQSVTWYDAVKWCNARSEMEGRVPAYYTSSAQTDVYRFDEKQSYPRFTDIQNDWGKWTCGYRLPTEAEWEYAARGGLNGKRFPWGDTISHRQANYYSTNTYPYDVSSTRGRHPNWQSEGESGIGPAGSFAANGYGLYDMAGNVREWCWDRYGPYTAEAQTDPRGPSSGSIRICRGGFHSGPAEFCRVARRNGYAPSQGTGFRCVLPAGQPLENQ